MTKCYAHLGFLRYNDNPDAETNEMQNNTATSNTLICQHDIEPAPIIKRAGCEPAPTFNSSLSTLNYLTNIIFFVETKFELDAPFVALACKR
jgi:hypothetical protein